MRRNQRGWIGLAAGAALASAGGGWNAARAADGVGTLAGAPGASCGVYTGVGAAGSATAEQVVDLARGLREPAGGWQTPIDRRRPAAVEVAVFGLG